MAVVYQSVDGVELAQFIAYRPEVVEAIHTHTHEVGRLAKALKAQHVDSGDSYVETEFGELDGQVILNDERGLKAAMSMEYGSDDHDGFPNGTPAQEILHQAAGLPLKNTFPRSRRRKKYAPPTGKRKRRR